MKKTRLKNYQVESHTYLTTEPSENYKRILRNTKTEWHVVDDKNMTLDNITTFIEDVSGKGEVKTLLLVLGNLVENVDERFKDILAKYENVILVLKEESVWF